MSDITARSCQANAAVTSFLPISLLRRDFVIDWDASLTLLRRPLLRLGSNATKRNMRIPWRTCRSLPIILVICRVDDKEWSVLMDTPTFESLREKLLRTLKAKAVLAERSKQLQQRVEDLRKRDDLMNHLATELLERQRELNFMLHRASSVLHQLQDTNLALSAEFAQLAKELPPPKDAHWEETIDKVNSLFQKTHELAGDMQDEIFRKTAEAERPKPGTDEVKKASAASAPPFMSGAQTEAPEPPPQAQCEPEPEGIPEAPPETEAEETRVAETHPSTPDDSRQDEPTEQLSGDLESAESDRTKTQSDSRAPDAPRKRGFLSWLLGRRNRSA